MRQQQQQQQQQQQWIMSSVDRAVAGIERCQSPSLGSMDTPASWVVSSSPALFLDTGGSSDDDDNYNNNNNSNSVSGIAAMVEESTSPAPVSITSSRASEGGSQCVDNFMAQTGKRQSQPQQLPRLSVNCPVHSLNVDDGRQAVESEEEEEFYTPEGEAINLEFGLNDAKAPEKCCEGLICADLEATTTTTTRECSMTHSTMQTSPSSTMECSLSGSLDDKQDEQQRVRLGEQLRNWVFSAPGVRQDLSYAVEGLKGVSLAKETNKLHVTRDQTGAACLNQYVIIRSLGQGSHGRVRACLNAVDGKIYAVKTINRAFVPSKLQLRRNPKARGSVDGVLREIAIMKKLDHPNVVKLHEVIDPQGKENIVLVTEFMEKGPLLKRVDGANNSGKILFKRIPEDRVGEQFRSVCSGLDYLHYHGIVHGDLKPDNLLVSANNDVKIGDFTCSRMVKPEHFTSGVYGTPAFHAPEVIAGDQYNPYAADIWALGVCIFCAVCGELPFSGPGIMGMYQRILSCKISYPEDLTVSEELKDLLSKIFVREGPERITVKELMQHPWLSMKGAPKLCSLGALNNPPSQIEVSKSDENSAIDRSSVVSFIRTKIKKRRYKKGDELFAQGDPVSCLFFVLEGSVALLQKCCCHAEDFQSSNGSLVLDIDESFMLAQPAHILKERVVHLNKKEAIALQRRRREEFLRREDYEHVLSVVGPGQMVGEMIVPGPNVVHNYSARAQGIVTVVKLTKEDLSTAFKKDSDSLGAATPEETGSIVYRSHGEGTDSNGAGIITSVEHSTSLSS